MRIALVSQAFPPETAHGGIATQTHAKAHGLAALGHQVYVISHSVDGARHAYRQGEVQVTRIPGFDAQLPLHTEPARWVAWSALVAAEVAALHARVRLDLVDFPDWGAEGYVHLLNRTPWNALCTVVHLHGPAVMLAHAIGWPEPDSTFFRTSLHMEHSCLRLADAIVSSSHCSLAWCVEHHGVDAARVPVLHAGVDTRHFRPGWAPKPACPTVVFSGRIAASKGVDTLIAAACEVARDVPDLQVRLVGRADPAFALALQRSAARAQLPELIEFTGHVERTELPRQLGAAHVYAAPSRFEGGPGFVYLEAMACGLPVVACSGSGAAEVVAEERGGLLVAPGDVAGLAAALRMLLLDEERRERMGALARAWVVAEADTRVCIARFERFYAGVIESRA